MQDHSNKQAEQAATTVPGSIGISAPQPKQYPDGTFRLKRSNGEIIAGSCQDPDYRLSRRPISLPPVVWYADCNEFAPPHTLRIYRLGNNDCPEDVHLYTFVPESKSWLTQGPQPKIDVAEKVVRGDEKLVHQHRRFFSMLLSLVAFVLRKLLWPIADFRWPEKLQKRQFKLRLTPVDEVLMNPDGYLTLMGDVLQSVQLRDNGTIRVNNRVLGPRDTGIKIPSYDLNDQPIPWIEWHGDTFIIQGHGSQAVLIFEHGRWCQYRFQFPSFRNVLRADLLVCSAVGHRFLVKSMAVIVVLFVLTLFLSTGTN